MKTKTFSKLAIVSVCTILLASGCGSRKALKQKQLLADNFKPVIMTKTGKDNRPEWTSEKPFVEDTKGLRFTGGHIGGADYALTLRLAKSEATKNLLESIQIKARGEFSSAMQGENRTDADIGRHVTDAVAWVVHNLQIEGIKQCEIYYEQILDPVSQQPKFNAWVQLQISKQDYVKAKIDAVQRLLERAVGENDTEAKEKALELLEKLQHEA